MRGAGPTKRSPPPGPGDRVISGRCERRPRTYTLSHPDRCTRTARSHPHLSPVAVRVRSASAPCPEPSVPVACPELERRANGRRTQTTNRPHPHRHTTPHWTDRTPTTYGCHMNTPTDTSADLGRDVRNALSQMPYSGAVLMRPAAVKTPADLVEWLDMLAVQLRRAARTAEWDANRVRDLESQRAAIRAFLGTDASA